MTRNSHAFSAKAKQPSTAERLAMGLLAAKLRINAVEI
jgi:hypothetical protein